MPRVKRTLWRRMIREDVREYSETAIRVLEGVGRHLPEVGTLAWTYLLLRRNVGFSIPFNTLDDDTLPDGWDDPEPIGNHPGFSTEITLRLLASVTPVVTVLGVLYQGWQGGLTGLLTPIIAQLNPYLTVERHPVGHTPIGGAAATQWGWRLTWPDCLYLASLQPLILGVLRAQGVERAGLV